MVIETEEHAKARGATPIARIMGAGITSTPTTWWLRLRTVHVPVGR